MSRRSLLNSTEMAIPAHCPIHHPAVVDLVAASANDSHAGILACGISSGSILDIATIRARVTAFAISVIDISVEAHFVAPLLRREAGCGVISSKLKVTIIAMPSTQE
jgi:hypothetical protein